jgi:hypothetical protein
MIYHGMGPPFQRHLIHPHPLLFSNVPPPTMAGALFGLLPLFLVLTVLVIVKTASLVCLVAYVRDN